MMNQFEKARLEYKPEQIKYLLVAETPPKSDSKRFFYFEDVTKQDSLFIETMKHLYPRQTEDLETKEIRRRKEEFLRRFQSDGFYLIDSLEEPFEERHSTRKKTKLISEGQTKLLRKIQLLLTPETKIILIAVPVYHANHRFLLDNGIPVLNEEPIDFPGSGGQIKFKTKMGRILNL